ncbi:hypothetical protein E2C01_085535 [Portunus trituberculatus]|uniref:Uncharacterized protein n=1 Tax=Portunus trituberculatus TaxID=210409 RepID=A0A5B7JDW5_PORTR|nr:hypothetical protein [Portunus trituberculatus]
MSSLWPLKMMATSPLYSKDSRFSHTDF